jgi:hypothetical protein
MNVEFSYLEAVSDEEGRWQKEVSSRILNDSIFVLVSPPAIADQPRRQLD